MLAHFAAINVGIIDREGIMGTGTTTVLSWLIVSTICKPARHHPIRPISGAATKVEMD